VRRGGSSVCTERAQERELERKRGGKGRKGEKERDKEKNLGAKKPKLALVSEGKGPTLLMTMSGMVHSTRYGGRASSSMADAPRAKSEARSTTSRHMAAVLLLPTTAGEEREEGGKARSAKGCEWV